MRSNPDDYRTPLPAETRTYELTGFKPENDAARFSFDEWTRDGFALLASAAEIPYEQTADGDHEAEAADRARPHPLPQDDLTASACRSATLEPLALPGESYKLAFTPGLAGPGLQAQAYRPADETCCPIPLRCSRARAPIGAATWPGTATGGFRRAGRSSILGPMPRTRQLPPPGTGHRPPALLPAAPLPRSLRPRRTVRATTTRTICSCNRAPQRRAGQHRSQPPTTTACCSPGWSPTQPQPHRGRLRRAGHGGGARR